MTPVEFQSAENAIESLAEHQATACRQLEFWHTRLEYALNRCRRHPGRTQLEDSARQALVRYQEINRAIAQAAAIP